MKEVIIDVDEKGKVLSVKPTTPNYNLVKPSQEDFYDVEDHNGNMDIIDTELKSQSQQITGCLGEIEKVREEIETAVGGIDLSSVNAHTTSVGAKTDTNVNRVGDYVAGVVTTSMRDINNHSTVTGNHVISTLNQSINTHTTLQADRVIGQVKATSGSTTRKTPTSAWKSTFTGAMETRCVNSAQYNTNYGILDTLYIKSGDAIKIKGDSLVLPTRGSGGKGDMFISIMLSRALDHTVLAKGSTYNMGNRNYSNGDTMIKLYTWESSEGNYVNDQTPVNLTFPAFEVNVQPIIDSSDVKVFGGEGLYHLVIQGYGTVGGSFIRPFNPTFNPKFYIGYDNKVF